MANPIGGARPGGDPGSSASAPGRGGNPPASSGRRATIGAATAVRGQVAAGEDIWIEGQVEGELQAAAHQVTICAGGRVRAQVRARSVIVEGELHGDVHAEQQVVLRSGARVQGDIRAPRVALEEGAWFRGTVDMDGGARAASAPAPAAAPAVDEAGAASAAATATTTAPAAEGG